MEKINQKVSVYRTDRITVNIRPVNSKKCEDKWKHQKNISTWWKTYNGYINWCGLIIVTFFNKSNERKFSLTNSKTYTIWIGLYWK